MTKQIPAAVQTSSRIRSLVDHLCLDNEALYLFFRARISGSLSEEDMRDPALAQAIIYKVVREEMVERANKKKVEAFITHLDKFV